jgi:hypothetical protein
MQNEDVLFLEMEGEEANSYSFFGAAFWLPYANNPVIWTIQVAIMICAKAFSRNIRERRKLRIA